MRVFYSKRGEVHWIPVWDRAVREAVMEYKSSKTVSHAASQSSAKAASSSSYSNICQGRGCWGGVRDLRGVGIQRGEWETGSGFHRRPRYFHFFPALPPLTRSCWGSVKAKVTRLSSPAGCCLSFLAKLSLALHSISITRFRRWIQGTFHALFQESEQTVLDSITNSTKTCWWQTARTKLRHVPPQALLQAASIFNK